jgi:hypothetical protein
MSKTKKIYKRYEVAWWNGYYNVTRTIDATSPREAINTAKEVFNLNNTRGFSMGENPAIKCGMYGEPWIESVKIVQ